MPEKPSIPRRCPGRQRPHRHGSAPAGPVFSFRSPRDHQLWPAPCRAPPGPPPRGGWVGGQAYAPLITVELAVGRGAEVILDVARPPTSSGLAAAALEFVEDHPVRLWQHVREHVEPAAVGHAMDDLLNAEWPPFLITHSSAGTTVRPRRARTAWCRYTCAPDCSNTSASVSFWRMARLPSMVNWISFSRPSILP